MSPVLPTVHDRFHALGEDAAWSESLYFNLYDPVLGLGLFTRMGYRAHAGTTEHNLSLWLPGGRYATVHRTVEVGPEAPVADGHLGVGGFRFRAVDHGHRWVLEGDLVLDQADGPGPAAPVEVSMELEFDSLTPLIGPPGDGPPRTAEALAASQVVSAGHFEQAGIWSGWIQVGDHRYSVRFARGNRDRSWGPRRWDRPVMWRWFSGNFGGFTHGQGVHFGGIKLETDSGTIDRGWIWAGERFASIRRWDLDTELADDGFTQRVVHLDATDSNGTVHHFVGDVQRVAMVGYHMREGASSVIAEGLTKWSYRTEGDARPVYGYGIAEYLHQGHPELIGEPAR